MAFDKTFWKDAAERAAKTIAQAAVAMVTVTGADLLKVDYKTIAIVALISGGVSILTSIASAKVGNPSSASLVETV